MKAKEALLLARKYNENCNYRYALKLLRPLYQQQPNSITLLRELSDALLGDGRQSDAIKCISRAIKITPHNAELWISRSWMYGDDDIEKRLYDLEHALALEPDNIDTLATHASALIEKGLLQAAVDTYQRMIKLRPEKQLQYIEARAANFMNKAVICGHKENDTPDKHIVTDTTGIRYSIPHLEFALTDYSALIDKTDTSWRYYFKRGEIFKHLGKYENALVDFDLAEKGLSGKSAQTYLDLINEYRQQCEENKKNHRNELTNIVNQSYSAKSSAHDNSAITRQRATINTAHIVSNAINRINAGEHVDDAIAGLVADTPADLTALAIARSIYTVGDEPTVQFEETHYKQHPRAAKKYCERVQKSLSRADFYPIGDYTPLHLNASLGKKALMRVFLGDEGAIVATAFKAYPAWPGFLKWLSQKITRTWNAPNILQIQTTLSDGSFVITDNTDKLSPLNYGPTIRRHSMPLNTSTSQLLETHQHRVEETLETLGNIAIIPSSCIENVAETQEQLRRQKAAYRKSINFITEEELQLLLQDDYDEIGEDVKSKLALIVETETC